MLCPYVSPLPARQWRSLYLFDCSDNQCAAYAESTDPKSAAHVSSGCFDGFLGWNRVLVHLQELASDHLASRRRRVLRFGVRSAHWAPPISRL